jgi:hypothetical protein
VNEIIDRFRAVINAPSKQGQAFLTALSGKNGQKEVLLITVILTEHFKTRLRGHGNCVEGQRTRPRRMRVCFLQTDYVAHSIVTKIIVATKITPVVDMSEVSRTGCNVRAESRFR